MRRSILVIAGTRPEGIKLAPVVKALRAVPERFETRLCVTGQHRQMLDSILEFFGLEPDYDLQLMKPDQTLNDITANAVTKLKPVLDQARPDLVIVQGDTTTAFAGALAAFYQRIPVAHVEAGLRTGNKHSPFPEEVNRVLISRLAEFHFPPTETGRRNLEAENVRSRVYVVGNTVIDALLDAHRLVQERQAPALEREFSFLSGKRRLILVTGHRRESFGAPFEGICHALATVARRNEDAELVYPVHLNPHVRAPVERILTGIPRVHLIEPVDYPKLVWLLARCHFVLTDSGGIQEEAPSLGKPVLVLREVTERPEGVEAGCAQLVGTDPERIVRSAEALLRDPVAYSRMARTRNPYGDGTAAKAIVEVLSGELA